MKLDVSTQGISINGEAVKEIEILYDKLLRNDKNIKETKPTKLPLIAYYFEDGSKWEFETKIIIDKKYKK